MANAFNAWNKNLGLGYFISVSPRKEFFSGGGRPLTVSLLDTTYGIHVFTEQVGVFFELGTLSYRADQYKKLILSNIALGIPVIPSDDEACWTAAASCADRNPMVAILHADEEAYFQLIEKYKKSISVFVCVSSRILKKLLNLYPDFGSRAIALPCGIFVDKFNDRILKENNIAWIGRLSAYQKRAQDILPIFRRVHIKDPNWKLQILGNGDHFNSILQEIENKDLISKISLFGWVGHEQVRDILSAAKVFLQTSDFEGTSVAMMEALASGCIIVSTRVSGIEDLENLPEAQGVVYLYDVGNITEASDIFAGIVGTDFSTPKERARSLAKTYFDIYKNNSRLFDFVVRVLKTHGNHSIESFKIRFLSLSLSIILAAFRRLKWRFSNIFKS